jgi:hypothetical protein
MDTLLQTSPAQHHQPPDPGQKSELSRLSQHTDRFKGVHDREQTTGNEPGSQTSSSSPNIDSPISSGRLSNSSDSTSDLSPAYIHSVSPPSSNSSKTELPYQAETRPAVSRNKSLQRSSSGFLSFASVALDKTLDRTQNAWANISEPVIRPRPSNSALARISRGPSFLGKSDISHHQKSASGQITSTPSSVSVRSVDARSSPPIHQANDPPSRPYTEADDKQPLPRLLKPEHKMHQTSSRLLRMTSDDRPFTKVRHRCH